MNFFTILNDKIKNSTSLEILVGALIATLAAISLRKIYSMINTKVVQSRWRAVAGAVRKSRDEKLDKFLSKYGNSINEERILEIVNLDLTNLSKRIRNHEITSYEAVLAYAIRAATIGRELNLITNINFENALKEAQIADEAIKKAIDTNNTQDLPPLIGVPVSIKDHITVKHIPNTIGFTSLHNHARDYDSLIVKVLKIKGAIPFVSSNIPQGILSIDSSNTLWGKAQNPWNRRKVVGGSSGGEAGLVIARCSPFGIGSDIGGSIRIPSAFCGTYGFKPTASRISKNGVMTVNSSDFSGFQPYALSLGPICRSADDVILSSRHLLGHFEEDPYCDNKPFDEKTIISKNKLKIGYLVNLPFVETAPDVKNKLNSVIKNLEKKGYDLVPFEYPKLYEMHKVAFSLFFNGNLLEDMIENSKGEKLEDYVTQIITIARMPTWLQKLISKLLNLKGETVLSEDLGGMEKMDRKDYILAHKKLFELKSNFISHFKSQHLDALLCPSWSSPAFDLGKAVDFLKLTHFMFIYNIIDMPCVSIPIGLCEDDSYVNNNNQHHDRLVEENMKTCKGMPVSVMIGTLPKHDELCLRLMKEIDEFTRFDINYSNRVMTKLNK